MTKQHRKEKRKNIWKFSFIVFLTYIHSIYTTINFRLIENTGNHANITLYFIFMSFFQSIVSVILITDHCTTPTIKKNNNNNKIKALPKYTPVPPKRMIYRTRLVEKQSDSLQNSQMFRISFISISDSIQVT